MQLGKHCGKEMFFLIVLREFVCCQQFFYVSNLLDLSCHVNFVCNCCYKLVIFANIVSTSSIIYYIHEIISLDVKCAIFCVL